MADSGMMPAAPMNGAAPNIFNDRRGSNPFKPVAMGAQSALHRPVSAPMNNFGGDSYNGQGTNNGNGALPPTVINGKTYTRDNPNIGNLRSQQLAIGERSQF